MESRSHEVQAESSAGAQNADISESAEPRPYFVGTPSTPLTTQESAVILNLHDSLQTETDSAPTLEAQRDHEGPVGSRDGLNPNAAPFDFHGNLGSSGRLESTFGPIS